MLSIHSEEQFVKEVLQAEEPVLADFFATWCGPCRAMAPLMDELDQTNSFCPIAKIDIDEVSGLAQQFHVASVPSFLLFRNGKVAARKSGMMSRRELEELVKL